MKRPARVLADPVEFLIRLFGFFRFHADPLLAAFRNKIPSLSEGEAPSYREIEAPV
jgi:hypothetical protein